MTFDEAIGLCGLMSIENRAENYIMVEIDNKLHQFQPGKAKIFHFRRKMLFLDIEIQAIAEKHASAK